MTTTTFIRNPDLIAADMDGETVMMSIEHGEYYGLGGVGSRVWELLERPVSITDLVENICTEFEVDEGTCRRDIEAFLGKLRQHGLVSQIDT